MGLFSFFSLCRKLFSKLTSFLRKTNAPSSPTSPNPSKKTKNKKAFQERKWTRRRETVFRLVLFKVFGGFRSHSYQNVTDWWLILQLLFLLYSCFGPRSYRWPSVKMCSAFSLGCQKRWTEQEVGGNLPMLTEHRPIYFPLTPGFIHSHSSTSRQTAAWSWIAKSVTVWYLFSLALVWRTCWNPKMEKVIVSSKKNHPTIIVVSTGITTWIKITSSEQVTTTDTENWNSNVHLLLSEYKLLH